LSSSFCFFFFYSSGAPRDLLSFPTRRSSDLPLGEHRDHRHGLHHLPAVFVQHAMDRAPRSGATQVAEAAAAPPLYPTPVGGSPRDRKSTRLNSSHLVISYAVFCLKKKNKTK